MWARQTIVASVLFLSTGPRLAVGHFRDSRWSRPECSPPNSCRENKVEAKREQELPQFSHGQTPLNYHNSWWRRLADQDSWRNGFPAEGFSAQDKKNGAVLVYMFGMFYMFVAIAITCDEFFVPALEVLSDRLQLSADVAGATLMAMGGSAPEFFTSCVGTWIAKTDVGIGTIVGSAVFNVLFVIGSCAITSPTPLELTWWPLFRDSSFYTIGLVLLTVFFIDERIEWWEACILFGLYIVYCIFMHNSERIEFMVKKRFTDLRFRIAPVAEDGGAELNTLSVVPTDADITGGTNTPNREDRNHLRADKVDNGEEDTPKHRQGSTGSTDWMQANSKESPDAGPISGSRLKYLAGDKGPNEQSPNENQDSPGSPNAGAISIGKGSLALPETGSTGESASRSGEAASSSQDGSPVASRQHSDTESPTRIPSEASAVSTEAGTDREDEGSSGSLEDQPLEVVIPDWDAGWRAWVWFLMTLPIVFTLTFTVPDVRRPGREWLYAGAFCISICWVALFTYLMVWFASVVAETFGMSVSLMGLTVLAVGTSIPDFITSVIVAKQGKGDMAVSSSIGSNIFDITVGLPVPWFCYSMWNGGQSVKVDRSGLHISIPLLLAMLVSTIVVIKCNRWVMTKVMGFCMFALYAAFMTQGVVTSVISESSRRL